MFDDFGREMLPLTNNEKTCALEASPCFFTGDGRSNQIISLTALHQLFAREHNRVASVLGRLNPHWSDDRIFEETRAIIIAKLQMVIYNEYLPLLIGKTNEWFSYFGSSKMVFVSFSVKVTIQCKDLI